MIWLVESKLVQLAIQAHGCVVSAEDSRLDGQADFA
jgi:hypothetical protein